VDWTNQPCGTLDRGVRYLSICSAVLQSCAVLLCIYTYISLINNQPHIFSIPHIFSRAEVWSSCNRKSIALFIRAVQIRSSASLTSQTSTLLLRFLGGRESPTTPHAETLKVLSTLPYQLFNQAFTTLIHHQISPCVITLKSSFDAVTFAIQSEHGVPIMRRHINAVHPRWLRLNLGELSTYPLGHL